ncbi:MAG: sugar ABC transporter substrate-binding protein [Planctomycetes bacterium]|nr:sugar ABC transporter substrate-binding protein [Planctomycetota bacterium]
MADILQLAIFCSFISIAVGCGKGDDGRTIIDFWAIGSEVEQISELFDEFERQNPDIELRVLQVPWLAAHEKLLTAFAGDATPDVCQLGNTWIPEFATLGALEPLDAYIQRSKAIEPRDYFPGLWETNQMDARVYGIPWYADTRVLFYRKDILAKAGWTKPPRSWTEWLEAMRDIKRKVNPNGYAILMPTNEWEHLTIFGLQTGTRMLRDDGRYGNFGSPEFRRALEFYAQIFAEGLAPPVRNTEISNYWEEFGRGYFAMYITGPWNIGEFRRRLPPSMQEDWTTAPLPRPEGSTFSVSQAGGSGLAIFRRSERKEAAWRLVEFLSRPEKLVRFYELTGNLPPRESAWKLGQLEDDPPVRAFHEQLKHVVPMPRVPEWEQITTKIWDAGQAVIAGETVDRAVADLDRAVDHILDKRRWMLARREAEQN